MPMRGTGPEGIYMTRSTAAPAVVVTAEAATPAVVVTAVVAAPIGVQPAVKAASSRIMVILFSVVWMFFVTCICFIKVLISFSRKIKIVSSLHVDG